MICDKIKSESVKILFKTGKQSAFPAINPIRVRCIAASSFASRFFFALKRLLPAAWTWFSGGFSCAQGFGRFETLREKVYTEAYREEALDMKFVAAALSMAGLMLNTAVLVLILAGWRRRERENPCSKD